MHLIKLLSVSLILLITSSSFAANRIVNFEPEIVELIGIGKTIMYPGELNHENIENGDAKDPAGYLILDKPIDVYSLQKKSEVDPREFREPEKNVSRIQLVSVSEDDWKKIESGKPIRARGTLFGWMTGDCNCGRVLMKVEKITEIEASNISRAILSVHYQPQVVSLTGYGKIKTYPGPPNYESIKEGDEPETGGYLKLDQPMNVSSLPKSDYQEDAEENVDLVQLVIYDDASNNKESHKKEKLMWQKIKSGKHIRIVGTLFKAQTGHHHARVLMEVQRVDEA